MRLYGACRVLHSEVISSHDAALSAHHKDKDGMYNSVGT